MNLAGVLQLPMIVVVENNEWAISVPFEASSPTATVAERAPAWAASGVKVDGNDVEKVAEAFEQAVKKARSGGGPSLIEASCYRFRGHFEGDADTYRSQQEKQERRQIDPLTITRALVIQRELATAAQLEAMEASVRSAVLEMLAQVRAEPHPNGEHALRHVFVEAGS